MERYIFVWIVLHISNKEDLVMAKKVVLAGACRTAIGKMGGGLSKTPAPVLGSRKLLREQEFQRKKLIMYIWVV